MIKKNLVKDAVDWIGNNEPAASVVGPTVRAIANLGGVPVFHNATLPPEEMEPILKEALEWLRKNETKTETVNSRRFRD